MDISMAGRKWYLKEDNIVLDISKLSFARKSWGKKLTSNEKIPEKVKRRHWPSKDPKMLDIVGIFTSTTAPMNLDLQELVFKN